MDKDKIPEAEITAQKTKQKYESPFKKAILTPENRRIMSSCLICFAVAASVVSLGVSIYNTQQSSIPFTILDSGTDGNSTNFTEGSIADVASKVSPGVVSIVTETRTMGFFGQSSTSSSAGTGMIVSKDGYVLTNKHVVEDANEISVITDTGDTYDKVKVVAKDPLNDVAFLKIPEVSDLPTVSLGDSKTISVGQQVVAIGNALGQFQNTVTTGVISGTGRSITATDSSYSIYETLSDMIQTDAAINAGNSGGPLVNAAGQVIGINSAVSGEGQSLGFAIPIASVKGMLKNVVAGKTADRAYIGVQYISLTPSVASQYNLSVNSGAYIKNPKGKSSPIISGGPADKAGLKDGDIITKVNDVEVGAKGTVSTLIGEYAPGDTIKLTVRRGNEDKDLKLTLAGYNESNSSDKNKSKD